MVRGLEMGEEGACLSSLHQIKSIGATDYSLCILISHLRRITWLIICLYWLIIYLGTKLSDQASLYPPRATRRSGVQ